MTQPKGWANRFPKRRRASSAPNFPSPFARSAARAVFFVPEIRQKILGYLSRHDLAIFMRVKKISMGDVAAYLYRDISGKRAQFGMSRNTVSSYLNFLSFLQA